MTRVRAACTSWTLAPALAVLLSMPAPAAAQGGDGFLFRRPMISLKFETGYGIQMAGSDVYDLSYDELTLARSDFDAPFLGGEVAVRANDRLDIAISVGFSETRTDTEFRDFVDLDDRPIEQTTGLQIIPVALTGKYYLKPRGRQVGRFAWIPRTFTPYVGGGLGFVSYEFSQVGDFVDFETLEIFYDDYVSEGEATLLRLLAGVSLSVAGQLELTGEARYNYARADLSSDFDGFDPLDLSGVQAVIGLALRF